MSVPRPLRAAPVLGLFVMVGILLGALPVAAQSSGDAAGGGTPPRTGMGVVAPPPTRHSADFGLEPALPPEQQGAREQEFYPERTRSIHAPAFVKSAVTTVRTSRTSGVRVGLSGWTAPRVPFDFRESSGGVAFGLSMEWGVPLPPPGEGPAQPASSGQR
jgi:hypothetical protein